MRPRERRTENREQMRPCGATSGAVTQSGEAAVLFVLYVGDEKVKREAQRKVNPSVLRIAISFNILKKGRKLPHHAHFFTFLPS